MPGNQAKDKKTEGDKGQVMSIVYLQTTSCCISIPVCVLLGFLITTELLVHSDITVGNILLIFTCP